MGNTGEAALRRANEYGKRLNQACDSHPHCPDMNYGRLTWLLAEVNKRRPNEDPLRLQSVSRWVNGQAVPRAPLNELVALTLGVDPTWLYFGTNSEIAPREVKTRVAAANGAISVVAGLIQMDGGAVAFPDEGEERAKKDNIDFHAVIKGAHYALHIATGTVSDDEWTFTVPARHEEVVVLGVARTGNAIRVLEITPEMIEEFGTRRSLSIAVKLTNDAVAEAEIKDFTKRL